MNITAPGLYPNSSWVTFSNDKTIHAKVTFLYGLTGGAIRVAGPLTEKVSLLAAVFAASSRAATCAIPNKGGPGDLPQSSRLNNIGRGGRG